jgi:hypothetical protein
MASHKAIIDALARSHSAAANPSTSMINTPTAHKALTASKVVTTPQVCNSNKQKDQMVAQLRHLRTWAYDMQSSLCPSLIEHDIDTFLLLARIHVATSAKEKFDTALVNFKMCVYAKTLPPAVVSPDCALMLAHFEELLGRLQDREEDSEEIQVLLREAVKAIGEGTRSVINHKRAVVKETILCR